MHVKIRMSTPEAQEEDRLPDAPADEGRPQDERPPAQAARELLTPACSRAGIEYDPRDEAQIEAQAARALPRDEALPRGRRCASRSCTRSTSRSAAIRAASRSSSCTAARAAASTRSTGATSIPKNWRIVLLDQRGCGKSTPLRRAAREHDLGPRRRHREAARAPRHRPLGRVRRQLGQHALARLRQTHPAALQGARAARDLPAAPERARVVLPGGREPPLPGRLGGLPRADPAARARRHDDGLLQAPDEQEPRVRLRGGARLVDLGGQRRASCSSIPSS